MAKSGRLATAPVQTGSYSAASRMPTTPALTPASAARTAGRPRRTFQKGSAPTSKSAPGRKISAVQASAPGQPPSGAGSSAPRKAAKLNSGPGTAWAAP
ncbi:Uncharacterised protein [Bordetella pertussis]|nr:hypothetical protein L559_0886 [Bordetella pertussis STO1-CHOC-0017]CPL99041.1 Uncharacterised protein [Bordetella pertussis]SUV87118.1 Uncharacterised protein [Bordetella pertussis]